MSKVSDTGSCPVCGGEDTELAYAGGRDRIFRLPGTFDVARCSCCGMAWTVVPLGTDLQEFYPESYGDRSTAESGGSSARATMKRLLQLPYRLRYGSGEMTVNPRPGRNRVLDVGCGRGEYLAQMATLGWQVWGIEPHLPSAVSARTRLGLGSDRIAVGLAEHAKYPEHSFDLITMAHVLEHLHDPVAMLDNAHRWLVPGGELRIWVPNFDSFERRLFGRSWHGLDVPRHLYHFTPKALELLFHTAGFTTDQVTPQLQAVSLSASIQLSLERWFPREGPLQLSRGLYYACWPLASIAMALGDGGAIGIVGRKS